MVTGPGLATPVQPNLATRPRCCRPAGALAYGLAENANSLPFNRPLEIPSTILAATLDHRNYTEVGPLSGVGRRNFHVVAAGFGGDPAPSRQDRAGAARRVCDRMFAFETPHRRGGHTEDAYQ